MKIEELIAQKARPQSVNAGEHVFLQGDPNSSLYVVKSGLLKAYYLSRDGRENIKSFLSTGDMIGSLTAIHDGGSCSFSLVCLKPCTLLVLPFKTLYETSQQDPQISAAVIDYLLAFGMKKEMREFELLCLSAEDRYRRLLETKPEIAKLVTQNEIARYLGITPVGLSRIKKRVNA